MNKDFLDWELTNILHSINYDGDTFLWIDDENDIISDSSVELIGGVRAILYSQAFRWLLDLVNKDLPYTDNYSISFDNKYWTIRLGGCTMEVDKSQDACLRKLIEIVKEK